MSAVLVSEHRLVEATAPPERRGLARDEVRMLVSDRTSGTHRHARFDDLPSLLRDGDLLVVNDSATLPAALQARRADGSVLRLHVSTKIDRRIWMAEPRGAVLLGEELVLPLGGSAVAIAPVEPERPRLWYVWFQLPTTMPDYLSRCGEAIRYAHLEQDVPLDAFQTIFAREPGSSEMPSAGRPFTPRMLGALQRHVLGVAAITLHCGVSSFEVPERPAAERFFVSRAAAAAINRARGGGGRVVAVGTTVVRALESAMENGEVVAARGWTDLAIDEGYRIEAVDALLTGFHDGTSTHHGMLRAFLGPDVLTRAYDLATAERYRCHEFGDMHLIA